jgi:archaellum component FlaC
MSYNNQLTKLIDSVNANLSRISSLNSSAALNIGTAQNDVENSKRIILRDIDDINALNNTIISDTEQITQKAKNEGTATNTIRFETEALKIQTEKNRTLLELRTAQAKELQEKYNSNLHSSYLGLWRPLSNTGIVVLIAISVFFALLSIVSIIVLYYLHNTSVSSSVIQSFFGGKQNHFINRN